VRRPVPPAGLSLVCDAGHRVLEAHARLLLVQRPGSAWALTGVCPTCPTRVIGRDERWDEAVEVPTVWAKQVGSGTASGLRARGVPAATAAAEADDPKRRCPR
jgi:hypothetical protein